MPLEQPSLLFATPTQSSQQSTECSDVIPPEQLSQSSDQSTQPSQPASKSSESPNSLQHSTDSQSLLTSKQSLLSTQLPQQLLALSSGVDSQGLPSSQQSSDQPPHLSSNSFVEYKHVAESYPLQPPQKTRCLPCLSHNLLKSLQVVLSHCSSSSAESGMLRAADSSSPPSSGLIPATFKSSNLELAAVASLAPAKFSVSKGGSAMLFDESSQAAVS